jgi:PAS domain S-box-containing protein
MAARSLSLVDLRNAIERREVVPFYQPLVELRSGQLRGFEVLARWKHAELGIIPPDEFIHLAESAGLIESLFESVMAQALASVPPSFSEDLTLSINVEPAQMRDRAIAGKIRSIAEHAGFPLNQLIVEITETALLDNLDVALAIAEELKAHRVRLALDDFGTGYSSLRHLNSLPLDEIKIDQSFVRSMSERRESHKIAATIAGLGISLGLTTVAEGIEDKKHADMLFYLGCELGQGWLYGRPVPADEIPGIIRKKILALPAGSAVLATDMATHLEASPAQQLAQLRAIYDGAPVGLGFLDRNLRFLSQNNRLSQLSAAPFGPRLGRTMEEAAPVIFLQLEPHLKRALGGERVSNIEIFAERPGSPSEVNTLLVSLQPVRDEAGEVIGISIAETDVTDRRRLEQVLREYEDHYRLTAELNANYPFRADAVGRVVWRGISGVTGRPLQDMLGDGWQDTVHPDDLETTKEKWAMSLRTGDSFEGEFRLRAADGSWHWVRGRTTARRGENGEIIGWYGLVEDIDARKRAEGIAHSAESPTQ